MAQDLLVLDTFLPYRLSIASNLVSDVISKTYQSRFELTVPEWRVIAVTSETDALTQQAIGQRTQMDKVTVSRAVIRLEARGLVERSSNLLDGRSNRLHLTTSGKALYETIAPQARDLERELFADFSLAELSLLMSMFRRIEAASLRMQKNRYRAAGGRKG